MSELVNKKKLMEEIKNARPAITFAEYGEDTCDSFMRKSEVLDIIYKAHAEEETVDFETVQKAVAELYRYPSRFYLSSLIEGYNEALEDVIHKLFGLYNKGGDWGAVPK